MGDFSILAIRIKELRKKMNLTQREFAELVGCTAATLSAYENGSKSPSLEIVKNIAEKTNCSIDWLCGLSNINNYDIENLGDIIRLLMDIDNKIDIQPTTEIINGYIKAFIEIDCEHLKPFFNEWVKMWQLKADKIIDNDVYNLWLEKMLLQYSSIATSKEWNFNDVKE